MKILGAFFILFALAGLLTGGAYAGKIAACQCYQTQPVEIVDFMKDYNTIVSHTTSCKADEVITSFTQKPEENPGSSDQFVYIESVTCCKLCTK